MYNGAIVQNAYVVNDLEEAMADWISNLGAGPFFVKRNLALTVNYRGTDTPLDIDIALAQAGAVQVELIKVNQASNNVYSDTYPDGIRCGFHHIATFPSSLDNAIAACRNKGYELAMELMFGSTRVVYMDTRAHMGCMIEFYEDTPEIRGLYKTVADAAANWDGRDEVRPL